MPDGRAIVNRNDLAAGMKQIMRDASGYYLLGYNSSQAPTDGKFHKINVAVKRKGVSIRARKGYWAYTAEEAATGWPSIALAHPGANNATTASITTPTALLVELRTRGAYSHAPAPTTRPRCRPRR